MVDAGDEPREPTAEEDDFVEVARAVDRFEAAIWAHNLDMIGIESRIRPRGGLFKTILFLGRTPMSLQVPRKDHERAHAYLKNGRFIL